MQIPVKVAQFLMTVNTKNFSLWKRHNFGAAIKNHIVVEIGLFNFLGVDANKLIFTMTVEMINWFAL